MAKKQELEWIEVDGDDLSNQATQKAYNAYRDSAAQTKALRENFNEAFISDIRKAKLVSAAKDVKVSHHFGKLSYAEAEPKSTTSTKAVKV